MKIKKIARHTFTMLLLIGVLSGILIGSTAAVASTIPKVLSVGWNYFSGFQDESPNWSYDVEGYLWLNSYKTQVNFDYIHYYNGDENSAWDPYYQELAVYDESLNDWTIYYTFSGYYVDGINMYCNPYPDFVFDTISSENEYVVLQQFVREGAARFSDYVVGEVQY